MTWRILNMPMVVPAEKLTSWDIRMEGRKNVLVSPYVQPVIFVENPSAGSVTGTARLTNPIIRDATMGDTMRVYPMFYTGFIGSLGYVQRATWRHTPEATMGGTVSAYDGTSGSDPDEWKWGTIDITLAGGSATDQALIAAVAGKKIQIMITNITVLPVTGDNIVPITVTIQDSDNVQLTGASFFTVPTFYKTQIGLGGGQYVVPWMGAVAYSATANRAIEADVAGGIGAEHVIITYAWREF